MAALCHFDIKHHSSQGDLLVCLHAYFKDVSIESEIGQPFLKMRYYIYRLLHRYPTKNVWEIWPIKINFGSLNTRIG